MPEPLDYRKPSPDDADVPDGPIDWIVAVAYYGFIATACLVVAVIIFGIANSD